MKVLWFVNTPPSGPSSDGSRGGGWMSALSAALRGRGDVELGIAFFGPRGTEPPGSGSPALFPLVRPGDPLSRALRFFRIASQDGPDLERCAAVVGRFRPDLVHVFGTERVFGLLAGIVRVPVVVHLQGLMGPTLNAWAPPGFSVCDYARSFGRGPVARVLGARALAYNRHAASRELRILRECRHFMGRTAWDRAFVGLYAPHARYYHCDEALRPAFFEPGGRRPPERPVFVSTVSRPLYKGHDVILKTAKVLCETGRDFKWRVFGVPELRFAERKTGIRAEAVHVRPLGTVPAERLRQELLSCTAYVHPSYIDNSPNSVCEAQVLGVPVVATDVGGVPSIVENGKTGWLVPANDPVATASRLSGLVSGELRLPGGWEAGPRSRNDPARVAARVVEIYREVLSST